MTHKTHTNGGALTTDALDYFKIGSLLHYGSPMTALCFTVSTPRAPGKRKIKPKDYFLVLEASSNPADVEEDEEYEARLDDTDSSDSNESTSSESVCADPCNISSSTCLGFGLRRIRRLRAFSKAASSQGT